MIFFMAALPQTAITIGQLGYMLSYLSQKQLRSNHCLCETEVKSCYWKL